MDTSAGCGADHLVATLDNFAEGIDADLGAYVGIQELEACLAPGKQDGESVLPMSPVEDYKRDSLRSR